MMISIRENMESIVTKGNNACFQYFSSLPTLFTKGFFLRVIKSCDTGS